MQTVDHELDDAIAILRRRRTIDFTGYKRAFFRSRLEHRARMLLCSSVAEYLGRLETDQGEVDQLLNQLRLQVTTFFRDPPVWRVLRTRVLPALVEARRSSRKLRVWSAGCSTGQEGYSIAMAIAEVLGAEWCEWRIRIYATNAHAVALKNAHVGIYSQRQLVGLDPERIERWTEPQPDGGRRIRRELREQVVFTVHDLLHDAPFKNIDLVVCRNVLMFFEREAQQRVLEKLRSALRPDGFLVLGAGEYVSRALETFALLDEKQHIYRADHVALG